MIETAEVASDEAEIGESSFGIDSTVTCEERLVDGSSASVYSIEPGPAIVKNESALPAQISNDKMESDANTFVL